MAWTSSDRARRLPRGWASIRARILRRDRNRCRWPLTYGGECGAPAGEVDHRDDPDDHGDANLWALCSAHHRAKTQAESRAARSPSAARRRPPEPHPGRT